MRSQIVAVVANSGWNLYNFRSGLIRSLVKNNHQVFALSPMDEWAAKIPELGCVHIPLRKLSRKGNNPFEELKLFGELRKIFKQDGVNTVFSFTIKPNIYSSLAASSLGISAVSTVTGLGYPFINSGIKNRLIRQLYGYALRKNNAVFFHNRSDLEYLQQQKMIAGINAQVVPGSGIDTSYFSYKVPKDRDEVFRLLFVGRLLYDKGLAELLEAVDLLVEKGRKIRLFIVGDFDEGNPKAILPEVFLAWLKVRTYVEYPGFQQDVRKHLKAAEAVVLPSYREGLSRSLLEAMSMSCPIIASDVPGCNQLVKDGQNGFLAKPKDVESLSAAIDKMLQLSVDKLQEMGEHGRKLVEENYSEEAVNGYYLRFLE